MKYSKKGLRITAVLACITVVFLLLFAVTEWVCAEMTADIDALNAGERWSADGETYATIVLHTDESGAMSQAQIENSVYSITTKLEEASIASEGKGNVWTYSFYGETVLQLKGPKASSMANVLFVGGNFFTFHPFTFRYGSAFAYDPTLPDGVVLDEDLAWRLFGTLNVVGMEITWNDRVLTVTGIVEKERDSGAYEKAYGDIPRMYMSYYGYTAGMYGERADITTMEMTLPNPVDGFAYGIVTSAVSINEDTAVWKENSSRYLFTNRYKRISNLPYTGMRTDRIVYPYFENELQTVDFYTSLWTFAGLICLGTAAILLLATLIALFRSGFSPTSILKNVVRKAQNTIVKWKNNKKIQKSRKRV